ncbi:MAG: hypothetical protein IKB80_00455 [Oscillospiraceae bacterium]|nr:hypothetical protein [Oscillospiraceae bacterium]
MKKLTNRYWLSIILSIIGVCVVWLGTTTSQLVMWAGIGIIAVSLILTWTIRCPQCGHILVGKRQFFIPNYCPNCGRKIAQED